MASNPLKLIASVLPTTLPCSSRTFMRMTKLSRLPFCIGSLLVVVVVRVAQRRRRLFVSCSTKACANWMKWSAFFSMKQMIARIRCSSRRWCRDCLQRSYPWVPDELASVGNKLARELFSLLLSPALPG